MAKPSAPARIGILLFPLTLVLYGQVSSEQMISGDPSLRQTAFRQLAMLPEPQKSGYVAELVRLLRGEEGYRVLPAFAKVGPSAVPALLNLLDDADRSVRGFAAEAIATIRPVSPDSAARLRLMLKDKNLWVQQRVAASLLSTGIADEEAQSIVRQMEFPYSANGPKPPGTVSDSIQLLSSDNPEVIWNALVFLKNAGETAVPGLIEALKSNNSKIRAGAAQVLQMRHFFRPDVEAACIQALQDPSAHVREFAREVLYFQISEATMDALLQDQIAEMARKRERERIAGIEKTRPHSRSEVLAPIPTDPDNRYPLEVSDLFEIKSPDGTLLLTVLHTGKERGDLLRVWRFRQGSYYLVKEYNAEPLFHLSAGGFRYQGKVYLHVMSLSEGSYERHTDEFFRIESGGLIQLGTPKGLPLALAPDEIVWNGFFEKFEDDNLTFGFYIWTKHDAHCCPTAGLVQGTYTIAGDQMKFATWHRSDVPQ